MRKPNRVNESGMSEKMELFTTLAVGIFHDAQKLSDLCVDLALQYPDKKDLFAEIAIDFDQVAAIAEDALDDTEKIN